MKPNENTLNEGLYLWIQFLLRHLQPEGSETPLGQRIGEVWHRISSLSQCLPQRVLDFPGFVDFLEDLIIIAAIHCGHQEAFTRLINNYEDQVRGQIRAKVDNDE